MQLLILTLDESELFNEVLEALHDAGLNGIVFPTTSLKHALLHSEVDAAPIFGGLAKVVEHEYEPNHTVLILGNEAQLEQAETIVRRITKGLKGKGVMFALPVSFWDGLEQ